MPKWDEDSAPGLLSNEKLSEEYLANLSKRILTLKELPYRQRFETVLAEIVAPTMGLLQEVLMETFPEKKDLIAIIAGIAVKDFATITCTFTEEAFGHHLASEIHRMWHTTDTSRECRECTGDDYEPSTMH